MLNSLRGHIASLSAVLMLLSTATVHSAFGTRVPVSAELGTSIAASLFPITVTLQKGKLFLTEPTLLFIDEERLGMLVNFQAYDHRPEQDVASSETGRAWVSGKLDYDPATRQVMLHAPALEKVEFDRDNSSSKAFYQQIKTTWSSEVSDPIRSDLPAHPYVLAIKDSIENISYDGENISISLVYR